jgi:hypothetical protein
MKKILLIFTLLLTLAAPMRAQVFIMEEDENDRLGNVFGNGQWNNIIVHGSPDDQTNWVPFGEGILMLTALGGAYLMRKKKSSNNN